MGNTAGFFTPNGMAFPRQVKRSSRIPLEASKAASEENEQAGIN